MDAFAVSICKGLGMTKVNRKQALTIGLYFGGLQALMPFIGYMLGIRFEKYITSIDHWIAFIPVSYTHLDVYKRQSFGWSILPGLEKIHGKDSEEVSKALDEYGVCLLYTSRA